MANKVITEPYLSEALKNVKTYIDNKSASSGSSVTVDTELSATSENAVANKAVKAALDAKADKTAIPSKVSQLSNDSGFLTKHQDISSLATKTEVDDKLTERLGNIKVKTYQATEEQRTTTVTDLNDLAPQGDLENDTIYILDDADNGLNYNSYFVHNGDAYPFTMEVHDNYDLETENDCPYPMSVRGVRELISQRVQIDTKLSDSSIHLVQNKAITEALNAQNHYYISESLSTFDFTKSTAEKSLVTDGSTIVIKIDSDYEKDVGTLALKPAATDRYLRIVIKNAKTSDFNLKFGTSDSETNPQIYSNSDLNNITIEPEGIAMLDITYIKSLSVFIVISKPSVVNISVDVLDEEPTN